MGRGTAVFFLSAAMAMAQAVPLDLPGFPTPSLVREGAATVEMSPMGLLRQLHRAGLHGLRDFETADIDYGLLRRDSLGLLAAWLEAACRSVGFDLAQARRLSYDGSAAARLLTVATGIAALRDRLAVAMPIGTLVCTRRAAWGTLPADGATDAYVVFATDDGMMVYDPPTRQIASLAQFPNRGSILRIRF